MQRICIKYYLARRSINHFINIYNLCNKRNCFVVANLTIKDMFTMKEASNGIIK